MKYQKIPNEVIVGGQNLEVRRVERSDNNSLGETSLADGYIEIAQKFNKNSD